MNRGEYDRERWEKQYKDGDWDYLKAEQQLPRYGVICAYMKHLGRPISLLDVGCGEGIVLRFCERGWLARYWGLDIAQTALEKITCLVPGDRLICSPLEEFSTEQRFDLILFNEVLYYTSNPEAYLKKYCSFLNDAGLVLVSTWKCSGWFAHNNRSIRSVWRLIDELNWKKVDEVVVKSLSRKSSWRIALMQP